jgi:signal transduction histidine kinase
MAAPACLAVDALERDRLPVWQENQQAAARMSELRAVLRARLRPVLELGFLAVCGVAAAVISAVRGRRQAQTQFRHFHNLPELSASEAAFPRQIAQEFQEVLGRISARSELLLGQAVGPNAYEPAHRKLDGDARSLMELLDACKTFTALGPAPPAPRAERVDLREFVDRLCADILREKSAADPATDRSDARVYDANTVANDGGANDQTASMIPPNRKIRADPRLLELALRPLLRLALRQTPPGELRIVLRNEGATPETQSTPWSGILAPRQQIVIHSAADRGQIGPGAGLVLGRRAALSLGGRLRVSPDVGPGLTLVLELPA